jgi:hypothetical protein
VPPLAMRDVRALRNIQASTSRSVGLKQEGRYLELRRYNAVLTLKEIAKALPFRINRMTLQYPHCRAQKLCIPAREMNRYSVPFTYSEASTVTYNGISRPHAARTDCLPLAYDIPFCSTPVPRKSLTRLYYNKFLYANYATTLRQRSSCCPFYDPTRLSTHAFQRSSHSSICPRFRSDALFAVTIRARKHAFRRQAKLVFLLVSCIDSL